MRQSKVLFAVNLAIEKDHDDLEWDKKERETQNEMKVTLCQKGSV